MRRLFVLTALLFALPANAATLSYIGTLSFGLATSPGASVTDSGLYVGPTHVSMLAFFAGQFGPINASLPVTSNPTIQSVRISNLANLSGTFTGLSGGPPGGGGMGLTGMAKLCLIFSNCVGSGADLPLPLTPNATGAGMGVGGKQTIPGGWARTMYHAPWTLGQPVLTMHTPNSTITTPILPGGFAHGPGSLTSSTAAGSGVLQLVTVSKVYTSLTTAFPEFSVFSILNLHFFPTSTPPPTPDCNDGVDNDGDGAIDWNGGPFGEPADPGCYSAFDLTETGPACRDGSDNDGDGAIDWNGGPFGEPADPGCRDANDTAEKEGSLPCDDGADGDGDGFVDYPDDLGCTSLVDTSEQDPGLVCDNGTDDDGDGLADFSGDPGCTSLVDTSEQDAGLICDNGIDDDGDDFVDTADPACSSGNPYIPDPTAPREETQCQDGLNNNDPDGLIDFDGGLSILGPGHPSITWPDPHCSGKPWRNSEVLSRYYCGLGSELALLLPPLLWLWRRRRGA